MVQPGDPLDSQNVRPAHVKRYPLGAGGNTGINVIPGHRLTIPPGSYLAAVKTFVVQNLDVLPG